VISYKSWTKHKQISDLACHPIFHHLSPFNCCWHISFCGLIKRITLKICVLCFVLINTKIAFLWTFYVFGWLIHWLQAHWFTATASKDMGVLIEKTPAQQLIEKRLLLLNEWVPLHLIEKTLVNSFVLCFGICRWSQMEGKERQPLLGEGQVTLEVQNPRELKREAKYKRSEVVSLQHTYPVSWFTHLHSLPHH